ncbi:hypothetical protein B0H10DRAFT_1967157 [Mycena sp. CBHHK59/15]|nr:hypothetical protein B0H10DRAFT_1967157 [Mycena sp. CBHHK59/15]
MAESLITPDGPTLFDGVSALNSYIIPEFIDVDRFNAALAKALVFFPLYAARLTLPPKAVTVSVSNETEIVPIEALVQKPLRFLPPLNPRKITLDSTTPLASILLTKFPKLGVTDLEKVGIPCLCPFLGIGIDMVKEEIVKKPDVSRQSGIEAMMDFKIGSDKDVFGAMITPNTTWQSMSCHSIAKEVKHSCRTVIIAHVYTSDKTRFAIHEAVDDDLEADKT